MGERLCTGGLDSRLLLWRGDPAASGPALVQNELQLSAAVACLLFDAKTSWFFCGLMDGSIKGYRQQPPAEASLAVHTAAVNALICHEGVVLSGSEDATVRVWR